jgi:hypothetical protein
VVSRTLAFVVLLAPAVARASVTSCPVLDVDVTPATGDLQIVAWVEDPAGNYEATIFITRETGSYGLGNRPGRFDFNSEWHWPYGRRTTTFPVWAHKHGLAFPQVIFQNSPDDPAECLTRTGTQYINCGDNQLSHSVAQSSSEPHYCRPLMVSEADGVTCPSGMVGTDKGMFSATTTNPYPPRVDLTHRTQYDSASVDLYKMMNPFDALSSATPAAGVPAVMRWSVPSSIVGDHVLWVEVSRERDHNATYNSTAYPSPPGISYGDYGIAYRGQPSILYRVPFTVGPQPSLTSTMDYAGYGDPMGVSGVPNLPDATITTDTPGSGASRLQLVSDGGSMFRVRANARPEPDYGDPAAPGDLAPLTIGGTSVTMQFVAPGDDGQIGTVTRYEVRVRADVEMTADNFADSPSAMATVIPTAAGSMQTVEIDGLMPETDYWVGIRAYDDCTNAGPVAITKLTTASRQYGEVDACFVATAAYGSVMANDVDLLRRFRDLALRSTALGELAIETYYTFGPALAGVVGESELLRATARDVLAPIVAWVRGFTF